MMTVEESRAWRPEITGWSDDILPFYESIAPSIPDRATIVELGVANGRSLIFLAEQLEKRRVPSPLTGEERRLEAYIYGIDHALTVTLEQNIEGSQAADYIELLDGPTVKNADYFDDGEVDMVFIDADHSYEGVKADLEAWASKVKPGGVLAGHDYNQTDFPGVVRAVDEFAAARGLTLDRHGHSVWRLR